MRWKGGASVLGRGMLPGALYLLAGCAGAPLAEKYFDRGDPFNTVCAFAYAIDAGQYRFAYDCLTEESQKLITFTKFKFAMKFNVEVPQIEIPIRDLILKSERKRIRSSLESPWTASVRIHYEHPNGEIWIEKVFLALESSPAARAAGLEDPVWLIDLDRTLRNMERVDLTALSGPVK